MVQLEWRWADEDALVYPHRHAFAALQGLLQVTNPADITTNVGELTPPGFGRDMPLSPNGKGTTVDSTHGSWKEHRLKSRRGYDKGARVEGMDGTEWHGTEAAFRCEPEADGSIWVKYWPEGTITPEEFAALPLCIQQQAEGVLCENELLADPETLLMADDDTVLVWRDCDCEHELLADDDTLLVADDLVVLIWTDCICDTELLADDDTLLMADDDTVLTWTSCDD